MDVVSSIISFISAIPKLYALIKTIFKEFKDYRARIELEKQRAVEKKRLIDDLEKATTPDERKKAHEDILN